MSQFAAAKLKEIGKSKGPPTFIPIRSEGAKRKQYQCEACWKMVPGTDYDQHERMCSKCLDGMQEPLQPRGFLEILKTLFRKKAAEGQT